MSRYILLPAETLLDPLPYGRQLVLHPNHSDSRSPTECWGAYDTQHTKTNARNLGLHHTFSCGNNIAV